VLVVAVFIVAFAAGVVVVMTAQGRFKRRRATVVALTAAISKLDMPTRDGLGDDRARHSRDLANAVAAAPNVFALDDYRHRARTIRTLLEATPRSLA
jgi:hypothetical protein